MTIPDIDLYLVDQDSCVRALNIQPNQITIIMHSLTSLYGSQPEFCEQQGIVGTYGLIRPIINIKPRAYANSICYSLAGSPATVVYYERSPMNIMRPKATSAVGFFSGQINSDQFKTLSLQAQSAAAKEVKNDASRVFRLPF